MAKKRSRMDLWLLLLLFVSLINETVSRTRKTETKLTCEKDDQMRSVRFIETIFAERRLKCVGNEIGKKTTSEHIIKWSGRVNQWFRDAGAIVRASETQVIIEAGVQVYQFNLRKRRPYLQLNLLLLYCYLCRRLINRLAIHVRSAHVISMPTVSMLRPIFAIDFCPLSSAPEIDPCSSVPVWILLLGICSPRTPGKQRQRKREKKNDHKLVYLCDYIFIQFEFIKCDSFHGGGGTDIPIYT